MAKTEGCPIEDQPKHDIYLYESDYDTVDKRPGGGTQVTSMILVALRFVQLVPLKYWLFDYERLYSHKMFAVIRRLILPGRTRNNSLDFPELEDVVFTLFKQLTLLSSY